MRSFRRVRPGTSLKLSALFLNAYLLGVLSLGRKIVPKFVGQGLAFSKGSVKLDVI